MRKFKVGIIGAGLQAKRRIPAINSNQNSQVVSIYSKTLKRSEVLAKEYSLKVLKSYEEILRDKSIKIVVVTTYPESHAEITIAALKAGKHVLCEKPLAKDVKSAQEMVNAARKYQRLLKCGFNHRFHPAVVKAKKLVDDGIIGKLLYGRSIYGYSGREGFAKEWRSDKKYSAGGILMEQGIHLVDLFSWFFGEIKSVSCFADTLYFPIAPFEDSAFVMLKTKKNQPISFHVSNLQWKNTFLFEVYGTKGYVKVEGLGGSYGIEKFIFGKKDNYGPFREENEEYRQEDFSWKSEWEELINAINARRKPLESGEDGFTAMQIVSKAYQSAKEGRVIFV
ncbi:Gfo/Idh/MocA family oxidoreductase [Candidatus Gottesmanbacteria bacterium]|nr:Gfo/Idh/MocA family oxidoreductase [Candidatus Gottesmanbacteria bacterium]